MRLVLFLFACAALLAALFVGTLAKTVFQEQAALTFGVMFAVFLSGAAVVEAVSKRDGR